jgi:hypothetical protein
VVHVVLEVRVDTDALGHALDGERTRCTQTEHGIVARGSGQQTEQQQKENGKELEITKRNTRAATQKQHVMSTCDDATDILECGAELVSPY